MLRVWCIEGYMGGRDIWEDKNLGEGVPHFVFLRGRGSQ